MVKYWNGGTNSTNRTIEHKTLNQNSGKDASESRTILYENLKKFSKVSTFPSYSDYNSKEFFSNNFELKKFSKEIERKLISNYYYKGKKKKFEKLKSFDELFVIKIVLNQKNKGY